MPYMYMTCPPLDWFHLSFSKDIEVKTLLSSMNITTFVIVFTNYKTRIYEKMKWLYVLLATFLLTSCGTLMQPYQMDSKMKDIELGMTKKKVISILGKDFESAGARMTSEGSIETISYKTASMTENTEGYYLLSFKDGKLVEWFKEKYPVHNHQH